MKGYYIISIEAKDLYNFNNNNYKLPKIGSEEYYKLFKCILDYSLDTIELEKYYKENFKDSFFFKDDFDNKYINSIINVKFNYTIGEDKAKNIKQVNLKALRTYIYKNGFDLYGTHYVRYKRSSGSSREGKCLFIDEKLYDHMSSWGECGFDASKGDLSSWESYKSLSLSSLKDIIDIPLTGILFIPDIKICFNDNVVCVEEKEGSLSSNKNKALITNDIWDGESLLDESLFKGKFVDKHMLLLRNKFFKSCAFKTKLQKWFKDKNITLDSLKERGFITFAESIDDLVMVTTPNSMKFLKFMDGGFNSENVKMWLDQISPKFGVVKYDKPTKFFDGKLVQTSYQLLNTLNLNEEESKTLLKDSIDYLKLIRSDYDFFRYHFMEAFKSKNDDDEIDYKDKERADLICDLLNLNYNFQYTDLFKNFRDDVVENFKKTLKQGHILVNGTYATIFGNGPEMLLELSGEFLKEERNEPTILGVGEIACKRFKNNEKLVCARSPHITMGNLYCVKNNLSNKIWEYFDLGENVVCVNAIGENIQQRLNGCDYDSDAMLITNDSLIVDKAFTEKDNFDVPVCMIKPQKQNYSLVELDYYNSNNKIGEIVNLSQKLNCYIWEHYHANHDISEIYNGVCKLAVLSGIEIDKAKRAYGNIDINKEISSIKKKFDKDNVYPYFFEEIKQKDNNSSNSTSYRFFDSSMEYIYKESSNIDFRKNKPKFAIHKSIIDLIREPEIDYSNIDVDTKNKIIDECNQYANKIKYYQKEIRKSPEDEKKALYNKLLQIKRRCIYIINSMLVDEGIAYLILKDYIDKEVTDWNLFSPILQSKVLRRMIIKDKSGFMKIKYNENGDYKLYSLKFSKE